MKSITHYLDTQKPEEFIFKILQIILLVQTYAMTSKIWKYGSKFSTTLWQNVGLESNVAKSIDKWIMVAILCIVIASFYRARRWMYALVGFWVLFLAFNKQYQGGSYTSNYTIFAYAIRYVLPFTLAYYLTPEGAVCTQKVDRITRYLGFGIAITFITHGIEALIMNPGFIDFLIRIPRNYLQLHVSQSVAEMILIPIGIVDILLGLHLIWRPHPFTLGYMAFWGILTASVRLLFSPKYGFDPMILRVGNGFVPLLLLWHLTLKKHPKK